jgi:hypothetical protein
MVVHVDEARYRKLSGEIENLRVARNGRRIGTIDRHNPGAANHDRHVRSNDGSSDINDGDVVEYDCRFPPGALGMKEERQANGGQ